MTMEWSLHEKVLAVCPIIGISFGKIEDKSTWIIHYDINVSDDQKIAAKKVLDSFIWDDAAKEYDRKSVRDIKYSNDLSCVSSYSQYIINNPKTTFSQYLDYLETIKL